MTQMFVSTIDFTPPMTPETETDDAQMDCDDVFRNDSTAFTLPLPSIAQQPESCLSRKHRRQESIDTHYFARSKRRLFIRTDPISDKRLLDISRAASSKYIDLGIRLELSYNEIQSVVGGVGANKSEHLKAFYVLQEWKERAGLAFNFGVLSKALENTGLASTAQHFCYEEDF